MLNECYTLWLNSEGRPVKKPLSEMTAGEVLRAIRYAHDEHQRLDALYRADMPLHDLIESGEPPPPEISLEQIQAAAARARAAGEATNEFADLLKQVHGALPQLQRHPALPLSVAVRRFWPR